MESLKNLIKGLDGLLIDLNYMDPIIKIQF